MKISLHSPDEADFDRTLKCSEQMNASTPALIGKKVI